MMVKLKFCRSKSPLAISFWARMDRSWPQTSQFFDFGQPQTCRKSTLCTKGPLPLLYSFKEGGCSVSTLIVSSKTFNCLMSYGKMFVTVIVFRKVATCNRGWIFCAPYFWHVYDLRQFSMFFGSRKHNKKQHGRQAIIKHFLALWNHTSGQALQIFHTEICTRSSQIRYNPKINFVRTHHSLKSKNHPEISWTSKHNQK